MNMAGNDEKTAKNLFKVLLGKYYTEGFPAESTFEQEINSEQRAIFTKEDGKIITKKRQQLTIKYSKNYLNSETIQEYSKFNLTDL